MGFVAYQMLQVLAKILDIQTFIGIFLQGFIAGIIGLAVGFSLLFVMKNEEILTFIAIIKSKVWKTKALQPVQEDIVR